MPAQYFKKKRLYFLPALLAFLLLFISLGAITTKATDDYDTVLDEITNSRNNSRYNLELHAPFSKDTSGINESIDPETGTLSAGVNLFSLPGRGGAISDSLSIIYSTAYASLQEESAEHNGMQYVNKLDAKSTFQQSLESFGIGWRMHLPYVEKPESYNYTQSYVHLVDGSVYKQGDSDNGLADYQLTDVQFLEKTETRNGVETCYQLRYIAGDVYYFNAAGYPVEKNDRMGNKVYYNWSTDSIPLLVSIADDSADIVFFDYNDAMITVRYKERTYTLYREAAGDGWLLTKVTDPMGRTTTFHYETRSMQFNFWGDLYDGCTTNTYYLLSSVTYPTGLISRYEYTTGTKWLYEPQNGKIAYAKLAKRYDTDGETRTNSLSYHYTREPDGCPTYKSAELPGDYSYTATVTDAINSQTTYVYDKIHNQTKLVRSAGGKIFEEETRRFDSITNMPDLFINTTYNNAGDSRSVYTSSKYDSRGNLIYADTYENHELSGQNVQEYEYSQANLCIYESSFKDADTKIEIKRTVSPGGRTIATEGLYENGHLVKKDSFLYDEYNNLIESHVSNSETETVVTKYKYESSNAYQYPVQMHIGGIKNADGETDYYQYQFSYDAYGNLTETIQPDKSRIAYTYDKLNRQTEERLEDGSVRHTHYHDQNNTITTTDAAGYSLLYSYDKYGKIKSVYDVSQSAYLLRRNYDAKERLIEETDARGTKYQYAYDGQDRCTSLVACDVSGTVLSEQYLSYNTAVTENGRGYTRLFLEEGPVEERRYTTYLFDYLGRQVQKSLHGNGDMRSEYYTYDVMGNCLTVTAPDGGVTTHAYDVFGNPVYTVLPDGTENYFTYDFNGNCTSSINGAGEETINFYDGLSRLTRQETTDGEKRSISRSYFDFRGNVLRTLDGENNRTEYSYDLRGFLSNVRQYARGTAGQETTYSYDGEGRITSFSTGAIGAKNKHTYRYELDVLGRPVKETDPMGHVSQYYYEPDGALAQSVDKNGVVTSYAYDGLGRLLKQINSKSGSLSYAYNDFGQVTNLTDGKLTVQSRYNRFGEPVHVVRDRSEEQFAYDAAGRLTEHRITDRDMGTLTTKYTYDAMGRPTVIETDGGREVLTYDKAGRIIEKAFPQTDTRKVYSYYKNGLLKSLLTYAGGQLTTTESMVYDKNGNKTLWEQNGSTTKYAYDGMNRLQSVAEPSGLQTEYEFDGFGNIKKEYTLSATGIKSRRFEYDANNRLLLSYDESSSTRYDYDAIGNLTHKVFELAGRETESWYGYDGYNRLVSFVSGNMAAEYAYNPEGLRESKTVNGSPTRFLYDGANIVGELTADNYYLYYRGTELLASKAFSGQRTTYGLDSHGSVTALTNEKGETTKTYSYNAYGKEQTFITPAGNQSILYLWKNETENGHNPFRFCGEYYDEETGLIYLRNRYYDPGMGRFITEDPIRDGLNWYVYCGNNPIRYTDSLGLDKNLDDYINSNYAGKMTVTIGIKRPVPNSREVGTIDSDGELDNGHTFLRLDDGKGTVEYLGIGVLEKSLTKMVAGISDEGTTIDDSETVWNVARVFELNSDQYTVLSTYFSNTKTSPPDYNIESYNCTTWAVEGLQKAGIYNYNIGIYQHDWTLPNNLYNQLEGYKARGKRPTWLVTAVVWTMGRFHGYTPADAAQDLKKSEGKVLLQYDLSGIKEVQNYVYLSQG